MVIGRQQRLNLLTKRYALAGIIIPKDQPLTGIRQKIRLITTKPVIYLVNLSMKDYIRQKNKYLPLIAKWVKEHGGQGTDVIPFSVEFEEKVWSLREDPEQLETFILTQIQAS
jgi:ribosome-binding ATPase YchF (GTP1/OBG family)